MALTPSSRRRRLQPRLLVAEPGFITSPSPSPSLLGNGADAYFFHHFQTWACDSLVELWPKSTQFWNQHVLALGHEDDLVRQTIAAVGAAHQLFMLRSSSSPADATERSMIRQYNRALAGLSKRISDEAATDMQAVLLCCLLLVSLEGMVGRYDESQRHLAAGIRLLTPSALRSMRDQESSSRILDAFAHLGFSYATFMDTVTFSSPVLGALHAYFGADTANQPFADLEEALTALRALDLCSTHEGYPAELLAAYQHGNSSCYNTDSSTPEPSSSLPQNETVDTEAPTTDNILRRVVHHWGTRLEATLSALYASGRSVTEAETRQITGLRLQHRLWDVGVELEAADCTVGAYQDQDPSSAAAIDKVWRLWLDDVAPLLDDMAVKGAGLPTFSLDGDYVPSLSILLSTATDPALIQRALAYLKSINRREGIWDSGELAEVHEAVLALPDDHAKDTYLAESTIPGLARRLSVVSVGISPHNNLLRMVDTGSSLGHSSLELEPLLRE